MDIHGERLILRDMEEAGSIFTAGNIPDKSLLRKISSQKGLFKAGGVSDKSEGHFLLSCGRHTDVYFQISLALRFAHISQGVALCLYRALKEKNLIDQIDVILGPPMGALPVIYTLQHVINSTNVEAMYLEHDRGGGFRLGRGFKLNGDKRILIVDDVFNTGASIRKTIEACQKACDPPGECQFIGAAVVINRSGACALPIGVAACTLPFVFALNRPAIDWAENECPYCANGVPLYKP